MIERLTPEREAEIRGGMTSAETDALLAELDAVRAERDALARNDAHLKRAIDPKDVLVGRHALENYVLDLRAERDALRAQLQRVNESLNNLPFSLREDAVVKKVVAWLRKAALSGEQGGVK